MSAAVAHTAHHAHSCSPRAFRVCSFGGRHAQNGVRADFFTVAVRTGGEGMGGISMLLLEKEMPGITCRQVSRSVCQYLLQMIVFADARLSCSFVVMCARSLADAMPGRVAVGHHVHHL